MMLVLVLRPHGITGGARSHGRSHARSAAASRRRNETTPRRRPPSRRPPHRRTATEMRPPPTKGEPLSTRCLVVGAGVIGAGDGIPSRRGRCGPRADRRWTPAAGTSGTTFAWVGASPLGLWDYFDLNVAGDGVVPAASHRVRADRLVPLARVVRLVDGPGEAAELVARVDQLRDSDTRRRSSPRSGPAGSNRTCASTFGRAGRLLPGRGLGYPKPMIAELLSSPAERGLNARWNARVVAIEDGPAAMVARGALEADAVALCCGRWAERTTSSRARASR